MTQESISRELEELQAMDVERLAERYGELYGKPPRSRHPDWLVRSCAWRLQEQRLGGLSQVAKRTLDRLMAEIEIPLEAEGAVSGRVRPRRKNEPRVGTVLSRLWRGEEVRVRVVDEGYEYDEAVYATLSAAVRAITGSRWNPRIFFGLVDRRKKGKKT